MLKTNRPVKVFFVAFLKVFAKIAIVIFALPIAILQQFTHDFKRRYL